MRINAVKCNKNSFKQVTLENDFNVILADVTDNSTDLDSRNGLGKSLLLDIISFCLGSGIPDKLKKPDLKDWQFSLDVTINDSDYTFKRTVGDGSRIVVVGNISKWGSDTVDENYGIRVEEFNLILGELLFGLSRSDSSKKYRPKFRSLISYFMRNDKTSIANPFRYFGSQHAWNEQVSNAFLLGLNWIYASDLELLKKRKDALKSFEKAASEGVLEEFTGSIGELESERVRLESKLEVMEKRLSDFKVHEQYYEIQREANDITDSIHRLLDEVNLNEQTANYYTKSLNEERDISNDDVEAIYKEAGVNFSSQLTRTLDEVKEFHSTIIQNRKIYLEEEINRLSRLVVGAKDEIERLGAEREKLMRALQGHGALDEYSKLQKLVSVEEQKLEEVTGRISRLNELADSMSEVKVEIEQLTRKMRQDTQERREVIANAIRIFNANSEALYSQPGTLSVEVTNSGYKFKVDIERADSDGVENMKVFCYDLMLAELWATHTSNSIPLFHDSRLFDGVDERQVAKALELANKKSAQFGFQYVCTLNSDIVPHGRFSGDFESKFESFVRIRLDDSDDASGTLLGVWIKQAD